MFLLPPVSFFFFKHFILLKPSPLAFSCSHESLWQGVSPPPCPVFTLGSRAAPGWLHFRNVTPKVPALLPFSLFFPFPPSFFYSLMAQIHSFSFSSLSFCYFFCHFSSNPLLPLINIPSAPSLPTPHTLPSSPSATFLSSFLTHPFSFLSSEPPLPSSLAFYYPLFKIQRALSKLTHTPYSPVIIPSPPTSPHLSVLPPSFLCCLTQTNQGGLSSVVAVEETHHMSDLV